MQRTYQYRGFVATVEVELLPAVIVADSVVASGGKQGPKGKQAAKHTAHLTPQRTRCRVATARLARVGVQSCSEVKR
jgi:predicted house-cleaning NTP pyrophosphatase (Maf/HAM1 superfamily)